MTDIHVIDETVLIIPVVISISFHVIAFGILLWKPPGSSLPPWSIVEVRTLTGHGKKLSPDVRRISRRLEGIRPAALQSPTGSETETTSPSLRNASSSPWVAEIRDKIERFLRYPLSTQLRRLKGTVELRLLLSQEGQLEDLIITQSSGSEELDRLAIEAVHQAAPFEAVPREKMGKLALNLPIEFRIQPSLWR